MPNFDLVYQGFPEAPHWVRWMDHVSEGLSPDSRVFHVVLSPLVAGRDATEHRKAKESTVVKWVSVGNLPDFALGDIFDGRRLQRSPRNPETVASVCDLGRDGIERSDVEPREFRFNLRARPPRSVRLSDPDVEHLPEWYAQNSRFAVLTDGVYPRLLSRNSQCLLLEDEEGKVILLPAAEVIRTFMLPASGLANAFVGWPAEVALSRFVRSSEPSDDAGVFTLDLFANVPVGYARFLAGMSEAFNPAGARAANAITVTQAHPDGDFLRARQGSPEQVRIDLRPSAACLPATFPFDVDRLHIKVTCFELWDKRFLGAKIVGGTWPDPRPIEVRIPARQAEARRGAGDDAPVPINRRPGEVGIMHVEGGAEPGGRPLALATEGPQWDGLGAITRTERPRDPGERGIRTFLRERTEDGLAAGPGQADARRHLADMRRRFSSAGLGRIGEVIYALDALSDDDVFDYDILPAPEESWIQKAQNVDLWRLPRWWMRNADGAIPAKRKRTVLVAKVRWGHHTAYWLEIEDSGSLHCRSILLRFADPAADAVLKDVVKSLEPNRRGADIKAAWDGRSDRKILLCKHQYLEDVDDETVRRLDLKYVSDKLKEVMG